MTEPTTNARRVLLARWYDPKLDKDAAIAAIEAEKEAEVRARLAEEVRGIEHPCHDVCVGDLHADCQCTAWVRQEILALIQPEGAPRE